MAVDLQDQFDEFLDEISIGEPQTSRMESATTAITDFLMAKYDLPRQNFFLQGSYPNGTAVEPVDDGEYDVDLVAICEGRGSTANQALDTLLNHFRSDGRYKDRIVEKKPCVRLEYAPDDVGKFHVDVVPVRLTSTPNPPLEAPRRDEGWHRTAPRGYTQWCLGQGESFARTVKILKRWRDEQQTVRTSIKSIVLQVLIAQHLEDEMDDASRVAGTVRNLYDALSPLASPPRVENPVYPDEDLARRWSTASFLDFVKELKEAVGWVDEAEASDDLVESAEAWREILGDDFPAPDTNKLGLRLDDASHEQSFSAHGWGYTPDARYRISITVTQQRGKRNRTRRPYTSDGPAVFAGHKLRFKAVFASPGHSEIWWQVTNTGQHARSVNGLRGQFLKAKSISNGLSNDPSEHWESTSYTGVHRVRAVLVRDNYVVSASEYIDVKIWSTDWRLGRR